MIAADAEAALFSLKSFAAAMIAYYASLRIGFTQPVWAVTTVYLVSQPLAGAVLSKAMFRLIGTAMGGAAAVVLLPNLVDEPFVLSLAMALWLGLCVFLAQLDRTPRSYAFVLAGYTACIIGFPSVQAPQNIFNLAILRVQEIGLAIVTASLVHGMVLPKTVTKRLKGQVAAIVDHAERAGRLALSGARSAELDQHRKGLAVSVNSIEQLSFHLIFDTARLLPHPNLVRALQDQLSWLLPLNAVVEDRVAEVRARDGGLPPEVENLLQRVEVWLSDGILGAQRDALARDLIQWAADLERELCGGISGAWSELLLTSLLARLTEFIVAHRAVRELCDHVVRGEGRELTPEAAVYVRAASGRTFHRDHGLALRSALGAVVAVCLVCAFWIETAWPHGSTAALIAGISCALFATTPNPAFAIRRFLYGTLLGLVFAAGLGFVVLPRVTDFKMLAAVLAPFLLFFGSLQVRLPLSTFALGGLIGILNNLVASSYLSDFSGFVNGAIAQLAATGAAVFIVEMFQVVGAPEAMGRLWRASARDIAARADGHARDTRLWTGRMVDRVALFAARAGSAPEPAPHLYDALAGLRVGYLVGELHAVAAHPAHAEHRAVVRQALSAIARHFRSADGARRAPAGPPVLRAIDGVIAVYAAHPEPEGRRQGWLLLTGLRRALFPHAEPFDGAAP